MEFICANFWQKMFENMENDRCWWTTTTRFGNQKGFTGNSNNNFNYLTNLVEL